MLHKWQFKKIYKYVWTYSHSPCVVRVMVVTSLEDWWARCWLTCPGRNDLLSSFITPTCFFHTWILSLFSVPPSYIFFFTLLSTYFTAAGPFGAMSPPPFIRSSNMDTSSQCHPVGHLQINKNTKQKPASFICPQTKSLTIPSLPSLSLALSLLSSFSLTISCGGLRTHQLSWV